jgi:hypothetical protein
LFFEISKISYAQQLVPFFESVSSLADSGSCHLLNRYPQPVFKNSHLQRMPFFEPALFVMNLYMYPGRWFLFPLVSNNCFITTGFFRPSPPVAETIFLEPVISLEMVFFKRG